MSQKYEAVVRLKRANPPKQLNNGKMVRTFVGETDERYSQVLEFECYGDKCDLIKGRKAGDLVSITFELRGREYNGRVYHSLSVQGVQSVTDASQTPVEATEMPSTAMVENGIDVGGEKYYEDLPF
jgi:hypothetical protein